MEPQWHDGHSPVGKEIYSTVPLSEYARTAYPKLYEHWHLITSLADFFLERLEQSQVTEFKSAGALCILDEVASLLPGRASMTAFYQVVSMFPQFARKLGLQIFFASPLLSQTDVRLKNILDMGVVVEKKFLQDGSVFFRIHRFSFDATTTEQRKLPTEVITPEIVPEVWRCFSTTRIEPAVANDLIAQLKAILGRETEKIGKEIVFSAAVDEVRKFFTSHAGRAFTLVQLSRELTEIKLNELKAIAEALANDRYVQLMGGERGERCYVYVPEGENMIDVEQGVQQSTEQNVAQLRVLQLLGKSKRGTLSKPQLTTALNGKVQPQNLSKILDRMVRTGLLTSYQHMNKQTRLRYYKLT